LGTYFLWQVLLGSNWRLFGQQKRNQSRFHQENFIILEALLMLGGPKFIDKKLSFAMKKGGPFFTFQSYRLPPGIG